MGAIEEVKEVIRRAFTGDSWYVEKKPFVLELRASPLALMIGIPPVTYIVLPLGLQDYRVRRVFRQQVTPTLGGVVADEGGELWKQISVTWDPGLEAKRTADTSVFPELNPASFGLSGPAWSKRVLNNFFGNYAICKADPGLAKDTYLIWHDMKLDEHYVVVPSEVSLQRSVANRLQFPLSWEFTTIGDAATIPLPPSPFNIFRAVEGVVSAVAKGVALVGSAIQEGSAILGDIRTFAAEVDSVLTNAQIAMLAAQDFADGVVDTMSVGRVFIQDAAWLTEQLAVTMEAFEQIPNRVRQNYMTCMDGLNAIGAQRGAFGSTYGTTAKDLDLIEQNKAGRASRTELTDAAAQEPAQSVDEFGTEALSASDQALVDAGVNPRPRAYGVYTSFVDYYVKAGDTLKSIAAKLMGDASLWYDLAIVNKLKAPYISRAALPDTVQPGDLIKVPVVGTGTSSAPIESEDSPYFTDMRWTETQDSLPGEPRVTLAVNRSTYTDVAIVSGIDNLVQALQMRHWTERGSLALAKDYGLRRILGLKTADRGIEIVRLNFRENMLGDPRVQSIRELRVSQPQGDQIDIEATIVPVGVTDPVTIRSVLV